MSATLLQTINDFQGYGNLSGQSTKGALTCLSYHKNTHSFFLNNGRKHYYMGYHQFLAPNHIFYPQSCFFDNTQEYRNKPMPLSSVEMLDELQSHEITYCKMNFNSTLWHGWKEKKRSIFFRLLYWKGNLLRRNLEVRHFDKNIRDNIIGTSLNLKNKSKDCFKVLLV